MNKIKYYVALSILGLALSHLSNPVKASTEDEVMRLWGVIASRQANIVLCVRRYPNLRAILSTVHEQTSYEAADWVSKIKYYFRTKGYPENDISQVEQTEYRKIDQRIRNDANRYGDDFVRLCKAMPEMHQNKTYIFRPLEMFYPNATNVLRK